MAVKPYGNNVTKHPTYSGAKRSNNQPKLWPKLWPKKIGAILQKERRKTPKQQRSFIGAVFFYRDMFKRRSHSMTPVTNLVKN